MNIHTLDYITSGKRKKTVKTVKIIMQHNNNLSCQYQNYLFSNKYACQFNEPKKWQLFHHVSE